ncbi:MAG: hypothetical protein ACRD96_11805, partial [Bryobacteraceae bacterium]
QYTDDVPRRNLTLVIEADILLEARRMALDRRTTVNQLVRDFLTEMVQGRRRVAREQLKAAFEHGLIEVGDRRWTRDELHERR